MNYTEEHFKFEKQLEDAICKLFEVHGIDSLNTDYRGMRESSQGVIVKAEHTGTDDNCNQIDGMWHYTTYRMGLAISVITVRQDARESVALSTAHWDKVAKIRYLLSRKISNANDYLLNFWIPTCKPTNSASGLTEENLETTTMNFELVIKLKTQTEL